jgi:hypothetical protein
VCLARGRRHNDVCFSAVAVGIVVATTNAVGDGESVNVELLNQQVQFRVRDIYLPDPQTVMNELYGESVLEGRVLEITENDEGARFAVVDVSRLHKPVLIALEHITGLIIPRGRQP